MTDLQLPDMTPMHLVAKRLGVHGHTLVEASARGEFVRLVRVGQRWYAPTAELQDWFARQHARVLSPQQVEAIRLAATAERPPRRAPRRRARANTAESS